MNTQEEINQLFKELKESKKKLLKDNEMTGLTYKIEGQIEYVPNWEDVLQDEYLRDGNIMMEWAFNQDIMRVDRLKKEFVFDITKNNHHV